MTEGAGNMTEIGYYNGAIGPLSEMAVPMNDRAVYFGDGVYEFAIVRNGKIFRLEEHLERFFNNLKLMEIDFTMDREGLTGELMRVLSYAGYVSGSDPGPDSGFVSGSDPEFDSASLQTGQGLYWQVSRGSSPRNHAFPNPPAKPNLMITVAPKSLNKIGQRVKLITLEDTRYAYCHIKTLNLLPNILARQAAVSRECDEAVFHRGGTVTECAASNLSILKYDALMTAPTGASVMPGITRRLLLERCAGLGIPAFETAFTLDEMMDADEVIVMSTSRLCAGVETIDGKSVGGKAPALLSRLQGACLERFLRETDLCADEGEPGLHIDCNGF